MCVPHSLSVFMAVCLIMKDSLSRYFLVCLYVDNLKSKSTNFFPTFFSDFAFFLEKSLPFPNGLPVGVKILRLQRHKV